MRVRRGTIMYGNLSSVRYFDVYVYVIGNTDLLTFVYFSRERLREIIR